MAPRSSRPRISGFCKRAAQRARARAPCPARRVTASGATNASRRALTSPSTSASMFSGTNPGPSVARPPRLHRRPVDGDRHVLHRDAALIERELARPDDDVAIEVLRAQADGVGDRHLAAQVGLVERAARLQLHVQVAGAAARPGWPRPGTAAAAPGRGARTGCPRSPCRPGVPATTRSPPSVLKCASSSTTRSPLTLTCSGRAASTRTRWTVVSPFAPSTARATDSHSSGSSRSSASGRAGSMSTLTRPLTMPRASPNATSSGASASISTWRKSTSACDGRGPWAPAPPARRRRSDRTAGREWRRPGSRPGPTCVGVSARCPAPSFMPRTITCARSTSPVSSGRSGRPPTCSLALAKPLTGTSDVATPGRPVERQLVEHDVEIEILVRERRPCRECRRRRPPCVSGAASCTVAVCSAPCRSCPSSAATSTGPSE